MTVMNLKMLLLSRPSRHPSPCLLELAMADEALAAAAGAGKAGSTKTRMGMYRDPSHLARCAAAVLLRVDPEFSACARMCALLALRR